MDDLRADLHSLSRRSPIQPARAVPTRIAAGLTAEEAFRATVSDCLAQITANAGTLRGGRSVEGLHQLRVGFRRLEVALGAFGKQFQLDWLEELRGRGKVLSSRLAAARDLDVFVGDLLVAPGAAATGGERDGFIALRERAERARDAAWEEAAECLAGPDFAMFLDDVAGLAQSRLPLGRQRKLPKLASRLLGRAARRVKKRGRTAQSRAARDLHHLRIALKKLRYTAEFFASLYPRGPSRRYLAKVRRLQDHLGALNDIAHARAMVARLMRETDGDDAGARFAAGIVAGWYGARSQRLTRLALKRYRKFQAVEPFWD